MYKVSRAILEALNFVVDHFLLQLFQCGSLPGINRFWGGPSIGNWRRKILVTSDWAAKRSLALVHTKQKQKEG